MKRRSLKERFWEKVNKTHGCWNWTAGDNGEGYGTIRAKNDSGKRIMALAHRLSWEFHHGVIPEGLLVLHHCDNPSCVRPDHLFLGTKKDNAVDRDSKGRRIALRGARHGLSKLNDEAIKVIRHLYSDGVKTRAKLAKSYMVSWGTVDAVVNNKTWLHIPVVGGKF